MWNGFIVRHGDVIPLPDGGSRKGLFEKFAFQHGEDVENVARLAVAR
jgi:hypothetical protein